MSSYKLSFSGNIITVPNQVGALSFTVPKTQYEKVLYTSPNGMGQKSGTISESILNFDEIIIGLRWQDSPNLFTTEYYRFDAQNIGESNFAIRTQLMSSNQWYIIEHRMNFNNTNLTWTVNKPTNCRWWISNRTDQNTKWNVGGSSSVYGVVSEIIGVKYK